MEAAGTGADAFFVAGHGAFGFIEVTHIAAVGQVGAGLVVGVDSVAAVAGAQDHADTVDDRAEAQQACRKSLHSRAPIVIRLLPKMKFPRAGVMLDAGKGILPDGSDVGKSLVLLFFGFTAEGADRAAV